MKWTYHRINKLKEELSDFMKETSCEDSARLISDAIDRGGPSDGKSIHFRHKYISDYLVQLGNFGLTTRGEPLKKPKDDL